MKTWHLIVRTRWNFDDFLTIHWWIFTPTWDATTKTLTGHDWSTAFIYWSPLDSWHVALPNMRSISMWKTTARRWILSCPMFSKETQLILLAMYHYTSQYTPVYPLYPYIYLDTIITHYTLKISNYTYPINSNYILYIPSIPVYDIDILMLYISHFSPIKSP
jgi:hypothetical protein